MCKQRCIFNGWNHLVLSSQHSPHCMSCIKMVEKINPACNQFRNTLGKCDYWKYWRRWSEWIKTERAPRRDGGRRINRETETDRYTLLIRCVKQMTDESLLCSTGNSTPCRWPGWEGNPKGVDTCMCVYCAGRQKLTQHRKTSTSSKNNKGKN